MSKFEIKNLKIETGGKTTVSEISLTINPGEIHVLMGPNGSGKSSLVNAIFSHPKHKIISGKIFLDDRDITELQTDKKAKAGLFLSMQNIPEISGVTILNFLHRAFREISGKEISIIDFNKELSENLGKVGISKDILSRPVNSGFSGGEKKQAEAVQLLALKPKFAFLDEIDSGVDIDSLKKVFAVVDGLKKEGTGFLLITHYPDILRKISPDFVHVIKDGKVARSGGRELVEEIKENGFN